MEIGRYEKDNNTHREVNNFPDNKSADTEFPCQQFGKNNKKQDKAERQEKGWKILRQWSLEIQHESIVNSGWTKGVTITVQNKQQISIRL